MEAHKPVAASPYNTHSSQAEHFGHLNTDIYPEEVMSLLSHSTHLQEHTSTGAHSKIALTHRDRQALHGVCGFSSQRLKNRGSVV